MMMKTICLLFFVFFYSYIKFTHASDNCNPSPVVYEYKIDTTTRGLSTRCNKNHKKQIKNVLQTTIQRTFDNEPFIYTSNNYLCSAPKIYLSMGLEFRECSLFHGRALTPHSNTNNTGAHIDNFALSFDNSTDTKKITEEEISRSLARFGSGFVIKGIGSCRGCEFDNEDGRKLSSAGWNFLKSVMEPKLSKECTRELKLKSSQIRCLNYRNIKVTVKLHPR